MTEIVLVTLAIDTETAKIDPRAPFMVNSRRRGTRHNRPCFDKPEVIEQFRPGKTLVRSEAEWNAETEDWIFGRRIDDA